MNNKNLTPIQYLESDFGIDKFKRVLGSKSNIFVSSALAILSNNKSLQECETESVINALLMAASLDLPINSNLSFAYIIPYNIKQGNSYVKKAQFQIGYKGFHQLALRTNKFHIINTSNVKFGEIQHIDRASGRIEFNWMQDNDERNLKDTIGYISYFRLMNGYEDFLYMSVNEILQHGKKYSKSFSDNKSQWNTNFELMALKTITKLHLSKKAELSIDQRAFDSDQSVINDIETMDVQYIDNGEDLSERIDAFEKSVRKAKDINELHDIWKNNQDLTKNDVDLLKMLTDRKIELQNPILSA